MIVPLITFIIIDLLLLTVKMLHVSYCTIKCNKYYKFTLLYDVTFDNYKAENVPLNFN